MNNLDEQYKGLLGTVLYGGVDKADRTGTGTKSVFGREIRHRMSDGFPILTTKRVAFKTMNTELKWFCKGDTKIKYLHDNDCHIWDGDYEKAGSPESGDLGPIYGAQWRRATAFGGSIDQLYNLVRDLKQNPDSRRHIVNSWNLGELKYMVLPPCHYSFQCYVANGELSLMWQHHIVFLLNIQN
jgi:thymidylate synthase